VLRITGDPPRFIAAMQLGVTLTSLAIGAVGERVLTQKFDEWFATALAIALAYLILTFFHVVLGELVPKGVALSHSESTALWVSSPVRAFFTIAQPFIWVLQRSTEIVLRAFGVAPPGAERDVLSEAELRMLVSRSTREGEIELGEQQMIDKVFVFGDKDAAEVMVAKPDVTAISVDMPPEKALETVLDHPYTRYPVYRDTVDDIVGVLHVRDLFIAIHDRGLGDVHLEEMLRPAYVVPENKDLASLLQDFRRTNSHFAIVVDEYGALAGICTLEDLIEEIVGEIEDEFDVPEQTIEQVDDDTWRLDGRFTIDEFNERFGTDLPDEDFHTVAGFVFGQLGRAPEQGDDVPYNGLRFDVLEVDGNRIETLAVTFVERPQQRRHDESLAGDDEIE
jgi:putative hemolysin